MWDYNQDYRFLYLFLSKILFHILIISPFLFFSTSLLLYFSILSSLPATTRLGGAEILSPKHIQQIESALPTAQQCYDWVLLYRYSKGVKNLENVLENAKKATSTLFVIKDSHGGIFGSIVTEKIKDEASYYGKGPGSIAVWSFLNNGVIHIFPAYSMQDSDYISTSTKAISFGNKNHPAIYIDSQFKGKSCKCPTFSSPSLSSTEEFALVELEIYSLEHALNKNSHADNSKKVVDSSWSPPRRSFSK